MKKRKRKRKERKRRKGQEKKTRLGKQNFLTFWLGYANVTKVNGYFTKWGANLNIKASKYSFRLNFVSLNKFTIQT